MSDSDILAVQLWFGAGAIAFAAVAMTAAGWNHKYFIGAMFTLSGLMALAALFWRRLQAVIPSHGDDVIVLLANDPRAWFAMFVSGIVAVLIMSKIQGHGLAYSLENDPTSGLFGLQTLPSGVIFIQVYVKATRATH
jgi:hypothetical protein